MLGIVRDARNDRREKARALTAKAPAPEDSLYRGSERASAGEGEGSLMVMVMPWDSVMV